MRAELQRHIIIAELGVLIWLLYQLWLLVRQIVVIEQGNETGEAEARETGNPNASATNNLHIQRKSG